MNDLETRVRDALRDPSRDREAPTIDEVMRGVRTRMDTPAPAEKRRRSRSQLVPMLTAAAAVLAVIFGAVAVSGWDDNEQQPVDQPTGAAPSNDWQPIASSPLKPRHGAVGVWTGAEMLVIGGTTWFPCPPSADCSGPPADTLRSDGAAYDPRTDTWRPLARAPRPVYGGIAAWSSTEMVIVTNRTTLAYDPQGDSWRALEPPPADAFNQSVVTDTGIVFGSYEKFAQQTQGPDWLLDPVTGKWSPLPTDPFRESYDRSLAWDGERLWLLSMSVDNHSQAYRGATSRVAVLEDDAWRVVGETPRLEQGQRWWWFQDRLAAPVSPYSPAGGLGAYLTPSSLEWSSIPSTGVHRSSQEPGCPLPAVGPGATWLAGGGPVLTSLDPLTTVVVPPCQGIAVPDVAVWSGDELIIWGGIGPGYRGNVNAGMTWTPPQPH